MSERQCWWRAASWTSAEAQQHRGGMLRPGSMHELMLCMMFALHTNRLGSG